MLQIAQKFGFFTTTKTIQETEPRKEKKSQERENRVVHLPLRRAQFVDQTDGFWYPEMKSLYPNQGLAISLCIGTPTHNPTHTAPAKTSNNCPTNTHPTPSMVKIIRSHPQQRVPEKNKIKSAQSRKIKTQNRYGKMNNSTNHEESKMENNCWVTCLKGWGDFEGNIVRDWVLYILFRLLHVFGRVFLFWKSVFLCFRFSIFLGKKMEGKVRENSCVSFVSTLWSG